MRKQSRFVCFVKQNRHALYILPWLAGFLVFQAAPMLYSLAAGFTDLHLFRGIRQTGLINYARILGDVEVLRSLGVTVRFAAVSVPLKITAALLAALMLSKQIRGISIYRVLYYLPSVLGGSVAVSVLWKALFRDGGTVNLLLGALHIPPVHWLSDEAGAFWVLVLLRVWEFGSPMLMFLAALRQIPQDLLDAARLDGAGAVQVFFRIKLPLISPVVFYNLMLAFCAALQEFSAPFVITAGGPRGATTLVSLLIYRSAFSANEMGYACALAWVLFMVSAVFSAGFLLARGKLTYDTGEVQA